MVSLTNSQGLSHFHSLHIHHDETVSARHGKLTRIARLIVYSTLVVIILGSLEDTVWSVCNSNKWCNCCCPESLQDEWFLAWLIVVQWFCQQQYNISSYPLLFLFQIAACKCISSKGRLLFEFHPTLVSLQESTTFLWSHNGKTKFCRHIIGRGKMAIRIVTRWFYIKYTCRLLSQLGLLWTCWKSKKWR